ncbi:PQQ-dependent dehydrogenase (s-GDH family) [Filimonas zeae]|uniref:Quinoprotein glucose dehydrogenase n=1 Tax=Filimonas zeae TaxID=1737353 RepID=A0A917J2V7_9BACT|nr:PQQ-dependent sugar dehydrogenase [Filimonas zeae]MDR6341421.1 PQQ-dependent dehydrogenase (s-GDH family) [Filimonas zeae]GGH75949.1 quinoprotein glucose dehydrogenase [Filimonas zeae]
MKLKWLVWLCLPLFTNAQTDTVTGPLGEKFAVKTVARNLSDPWEITYGPDKHLWITEARGYRVSRIHPRTGEKQILLNLSNRKNFQRYDVIADSLDGGKPWPQSGLMGMAVHPLLQKGMPYVYVAYLYYFEGADQSGTGCLPGRKGCIFRTRIERYQYDSIAHTLTNPVTICESIPGSNDHNGGRLIIAPVNQQYFLFYSVGDMGAGQYDNAGRENHAQDEMSYEGKILRFHTLPDSSAAGPNAWIPADNPFNPSQQHRNAVWSVGHRNPQGLVHHPATGKLYEVEHGPFSDDEINMIERGKNYGHPLVIGYNDGNYNQLAAGATADSTLPGKWHTSYPFIHSEQENARAIGPDYRNPMNSLYPAAGRMLSALLPKIITGNNENKEWLSEAPAGMTLYTSNAIPGWHNSLLIATLKGGRLVRLQLNNTGDSIISDTVMYFRDQVRYRDVAVSADGWKIYLATDSATRSSGPSGDKGIEYENRGVILEFTYIGKSKPAAPPVPAPVPVSGSASPLIPAHRYYSYNEVP